jgi:hypothetical protein
MESAHVAELATLVRESYSVAALDPGVTEPTIVEAANGFRSIALPRDQQVEPLRSLRLIDATAMDTVLVITFGWDDGTDDRTVYLMPFDARDLDLDLDLTDEIAVSTFLLQHIEHTLGGPRDTWASRSTMISTGLSVIVPWTSR